MKSLKKFAGIALITILAATVTFAGTIVGGRNGTIVGGRNGTIVGGRNGIILTSADQRFRSNIQDELLSSLVLYLSLMW